MVSLKIGKSIEVAYERGAEFFVRLPLLGDMLWLNSDGSEVVAYIAIAAAVASTAASLYTQSEQASITEAYQNHAQRARDQEIRDNYAFAVESMTQQQKSIQERQRQEGEAAVTEEARNARDAAEARATARTAAGEAGVSGLSVEALLSDFTRQESQYRYGVRRNLGIATDQLTAEMEGVRATTQGRAASIPRLNLEPVNGPSYLGAALRIGGDALGAYSKYNASKPSNPTPATRRTLPVDSDW